MRMCSIPHCPLFSLRTPHYRSEAYDERFGERSPRHECFIWHAVVGSVHASCPAGRCCVQLQPATCAGSALPLYTLSAHNHTRCLLTPPPPGGPFVGSLLPSIQWRRTGFVPGDGPLIRTPTDPTPAPLPLELALHKCHSLHCTCTRANTDCSTSTGCGRGRSSSEPILLPAFDIYSLSAF